MLHEDSASEVRYAVANNPCCPIAILERLVKDENGKTARRADSRLRRIWAKHVGIVSGNLSGPEELAGDGETQLRQADFGSEPGQSVNVQDAEYKRLAS
jgi:hypothetical protein